MWCLDNWKSILDWKRLNLNIIKVRDSGSKSKHNQIVWDPKSPTRLENSMIQVVRMGSLGGDSVISN